MDNEQIRILLIEDCETNLGLSRLLSQPDRDNFRVHQVGSCAEMPYRFDSNSHHVAIINSTTGYGLQLLAIVRRLGYSFPVVMVTSGEASEAIEALRSGATDCVVREGLTAALLERSVCYAIARARASALGKERELRYLALLDNADEIIYTHDFEGNYTSTNRAGERLIGYTQEETAGLNVIELVAPQYRDTVREMIRRNIHEQRRTCYEI